MSAKNTWESLRQCWINTYLCLLDIITYHIGTNFNFMEFCAKAKILNIIYYQIFVEAHWSIEKVEKYYTFIH